MSEGTTINGVTIQRGGEKPKRMSIFAWGDAGAGKSTLAATMPGRKLIFQFDPDGDSSISHVDNLDIADFSGAKASVVDSFKNEGNPLGLKTVLNDYDSFIYDSVTNITDKTLLQGIDKTTGATIERPSPGAYGVRNALAVRLIKNVMSITGAANKHVMFIGHEGAPTTDEKTGQILHIGVALGGQLANNIGIDFSEMWAMYQVDGRAERRLMIRPARKRKPMKTRMFIQSGEPEFDWGFDADNWNDPKNKKWRVDTWYDLWVKHGNKLPLPDTKEFDKLLDKYGMLD